MKLFELHTLPKTAGLAELEPGKNWQPVRDGKKINIPFFPEVEFFVLKDGDQFLLRFSCDNRYQYFFGGTDEQPFLVQLRDEPFFAFVRGGEQGFFEALKPPMIRELEKIYQTTAKRQGDIFAMPIPYTWQELQDAIFVSCGRKLEIEGGPKNMGSDVFHTRHNLKGKVIKYGLEHEIRMFGEGVLEAPDHAPVKLEGVHLLGQATGLFDPPRAD